MGQKPSLQINVGSRNPEGMQPWPYQILRVRRRSSTTDVPNQYRQAEETLENADEIMAIIPMDQFQKIDIRVDMAKSDQHWWKLDTGMKKMLENTPGVEFRGRWASEETEGYIASLFGGRAPLVSTQVAMRKKCRNPPCIKPPRVGVDPLSNEPFDYCSKHCKYPMLGPEINDLYIPIPHAKNRFSDQDSDAFKKLLPYIQKSDVDNAYIEDKLKDAKNHFIAWLPNVGLLIINSTDGDFTKPMSTSSGDTVFVVKREYVQSLQQKAGGREVVSYFEQKCWYKAEKHGVPFIMYFMESIPGKDPKGVSIGQRHQEMGFKFLDGNDEPGRNATGGMMYKLVALGIRAKFPQARPVPWSDVKTWFEKSYGPTISFPEPPVGRSTDSKVPTQYPFPYKFG